MGSEKPESPSASAFQPAVAGSAGWAPSHSIPPPTVAEASGSNTPKDVLPTAKSPSGPSSHHEQTHLEQSEEVANPAGLNQADNVLRHIRESILSGDDDNVVRLLQSQPDLVTSASDRGRTPLHLAVDHERTSIVGLLLLYGANTEATDGSGRTALHLASKNGNLEIIRVLLEAGANLEAVSMECEKPLWIAVRANREHAVELLLDKEANPESFNNKTGTTALTEAVKLRYLSQVEMLLAHGADADANATKQSNLENEPTDSDSRNSDGIVDLQDTSTNSPSPKSSVQIDSRIKPPQSSRPISEKAKKRLHVVINEPQVRPHIMRPHMIGAEAAPVSAHSSNDERYLGPGPDQSSVPRPGMPRVNTSRHKSTLLGNENEERRWTLFGGKTGEEKSKVGPASRPLKHAEDQLPPDSPAPENHNSEGSGGGPSDFLHFTDCLGREHSFPFHTVQTWHGMEEWIKLSFAYSDQENMKNKVLEGGYDLVGPDEEVIHPSLWDTTVRPGWHVKQLMWPQPTRPSPHAEGLSETLSQARSGKTAENSPLLAEETLTQSTLGTQRSQRPLHEAIQQGDPELVRLLLRHGANARLRGFDGSSGHQTAERISKELADMIRVGVTQKGPSMSPPPHQDLGNKPTLSRPRAPPLGSKKRNACKSFEATVTQFYLNGKEERYQKSLSIYELLYDKGPQAWFQSQSVKSPPPTFTWYHLPANNMEWVEHLIFSIFMDQHMKGEEDIPLASDRYNNTSRLGLQKRFRALRYKAHNITKSWRLTRHSFMKPLCMEVHDDYTQAPGNMQPLDTASGDIGEPRGVPLVVAFIPFLHFETSQGQKMVTDCVKRSRGARTELDGQSSRATHPIEQLISGYLVQNSSDSIMGLQPRRSLDDYFFTHLQSSGTKDTGQVLYRFFKSRSPQQEPKIFMVDQLWMWILDDSTIITCSPLNWNAWASEVDDEGQIKHVWQGEDTINIQKKVIDHLKQTSNRACITSVHEMAQLIADKCASLFDAHNLDDDLHFFDFFEKTITRVNDDATNQLDKFRRSLRTPRMPDRFAVMETFDIQPEMNLLIEVEDISDELGILEMVLDEQKDTLNNMRKILSPRIPTQWEENQILLSHFAWTKRMKETNKKTQDTLHHLLELKQAQYAAKQAQLMAAQSLTAVQNSKITNEQLNLMRAQTDETAKQLKAANKQLGLTTELLGMMQRQSEESDKQSKTLLVFTVVTIVFLPSSFLGTVFAINMDAFPLNSAGQMPLGYFLKYLFAISVAICFPLLIVAFNLPKISQFLKNVKGVLMTEWQNERPRLLLNIIVPLGIISVSLALLVPLWTSTLSVMIKAAVTACVGILLLVGVMTHLISNLYQASRARSSAGILSMPLAA